jgi:2-iminoacetate synthase
MEDAMNTGFIDQEKIYRYLNETTPPTAEELGKILTHAREMKGVSFEEAERLLMVEDPKHLKMMFEVANYIKTEIYGSRLVLFAPLFYVLIEKIFGKKGRHESTEIPGISSSGGESHE